MWRGHRMSWDCFARSLIESVEPLPLIPGYVWIPNSLQSPVHFGVRLRCKRVFGGTQVTPVAVPGSSGPCFAHSCR